MKIITKRLVLREMDKNDFDDLYKVLADSDIMKHYPYIFDNNRVNNWINKNIDRYKIFGFGLWGVCLKDTGELIGDCGVTMQNINGQIKPEIGYHIRKNYQRKGYAKEASQAVRDWIFENTTFNTIFSYMNSENIPSIKTAISYGCRFIEEYANENKQKIKVYAITREEWEKEFKKNL